MARLSKASRKAAKVRAPSQKPPAEKKLQPQSSPEGSRSTTGTQRVSADLAAAHGLKRDEYERIRGLIGRTPSMTELGIFSAMWNEHCSYKSSKIHLRTLPTQAPG